jgi:hypothetical protein
MSSGDDWAIRGLFDELPEWRESDAVVFVLLRGTEVVRGEESGSASLCPVFGEGCSESVDATSSAAACFWVFNFCSAPEARSQTVCGPCAGDGGSASVIFAESLGLVSFVFAANKSPVLLAGCTAGGPTDCGIAEA